MAAQPAESRGINRTDQVYYAQLHRILRDDDHAHDTLLIGHYINIHPAMRETTMDTHDMSPAWSLQLTANSG